jgi:hypothetical protein
VHLYCRGASHGMRLPRDDVQLQELKFDSLMGNRYTEILLVFGNAVTGDYMAGVYNTVGLNSPDGKGDSSPAKILDKVDMKKVKKDNGGIEYRKERTAFLDDRHFGCEGRS